MLVYQRVRIYFINCPGGLKELGEFPKPFFTTFHSWSADVGFTVRVFRSFFFGLRCGRKFDGESFLIWIATNDTTMTYPGHTILTWDCPLGCFYQKCFQFSSWTFPIRRWAVHNWFIASSWVQNPPLEVRSRPKVRPPSLPVIPP